MSNGLERGMAILQLLAASPEAVPLHQIAETLDIPRSATHRLLTSLANLGYVQPDSSGQGAYQLSLKLVSLALQHLSQKPMVDLARPILDRLAIRSGELVRLGMLDGERLIWISKAQGCRSGLRYDPDSGAEARLSCSASGHAWLATLSDEEALRMIFQQGLGSREDYGPEAPETVEQLLACLQQARQDGYARVSNSFEAGAAALATAIRRPGHPACGVLSIAGPSVRLTAERIRALAPDLLEAAQELSLLNPGLNTQPTLSLVGH